MSESTNLHSPSPVDQTTTSSWRPLFFTLILPIALASLLFHLDPFQPAHFPADVMSRCVLTAPARNDKMRGGSEAVAEGHVEGPEDLVCDAATGVLYTGCKDGWIKRVTVKESAADSVVESLVRIEGRPLGVALDRNGELIVADSDKAMAMIVKYVGKPNMERNNAGVVAVDWEGRLKAHYYDSQLSMISSAIKIGNHLYCGSVHYPFIVRLDLNKYPAQPTM